MRKLVLGAKGNTNDLRAVILAQLGISKWKIAKETGLSEGQISYRMKLLGIKLSDYRNGENFISQRVIAGSQPYPLVREQMIKLLKEHNA